MFRSIRSKLGLTRSEYFIAAGYHHRDAASYFDDTASKDEWQLEVYERARQLMRDEKLETVVDVGCGSGFKLVRLLGEFQTTGIDVEPTLTYLRSQYPDRKWVEALTAESAELSADLVICSDVIEHVVNPDELAAYLKKVARKFILISTPARELVYGGLHLGPPANPTHLREWTFEEFGRYLRSKFEVREHTISNEAQATQMALCVTS